jgi:DNA-binding protein Fis
MPSRATDETSRRAFLRSPASFGLSAIDRACVTHLIGHTLARVEQELILQTLRYNQGNRTRAAGLLGISIRSLRDRIRNYRDQGEYVPDPGATGPTAADFRH